jgi:hypothetical protein
MKTKTGITRLAREKKADHILLAIKRIELLSSMSMRMFRDPKRSVPEELQDTYEAINIVFKNAITAEEEYLISLFLDHYTTA